MMRLSLFLVTLGLASALAACDLDVTNLNTPDRERALAEPENLETLIGGTFSVFYLGLDRPSVVNLFPAVATEMVTTTPTFRGLQNNQEPRSPYSNALGIGSSGPWGPRRFWGDLNEIAASTHDGLALLDTGIRIEVGNSDNTDRARAFAKFMQGVAWGYMAMLYDRAIILPETEEYASDPAQQAVERLTPREEALDTALASLEEAMAIARQGSFSFPTAASLLYFGTPTPLSTDDFVQLASTIAARLIVLSARTPQERAALDWGRVRQYTEQGLQRDFEVVLQQGQRTSLLYARTQLNPVGCANCLRMDYRLIGLADVSGAYQDWFVAGLSDRRRFDIVTPDRRVTGTTPRSDGAYIQYHEDDNGFTAGGGLYLFSGYQWARHINSGFEPNTGTQPMVTVDENNLLRAEALLRTGNLQGAADLINITRTRSHTLPDGETYPGLPPVTTQGVPVAENCVPRTDDGTCGDLMVALRYERMLELVTLDAIRGWADSRGFGTLPDGTWLQLPIPIEELNVLGEPSYTFGGVGAEWGAVYAPVTMADL